MTVPDGWRQARFDSFTEVGRSLVQPDEAPYSDYLHVGPENIQSGTGRILNLKRASDIGLISGKYVFDEHALVYSKVRPNLNKVCIPGFVGLCSADAYPIWVEESEADLRFLLHHVLSSQFLRQVVAASMRTGMPKVNRQDLGAVKVLLPPLEEQRRIAEILGAWDEAIEKVDDLIQAKQKLKRGLMQYLLCGKLRHPEFALTEWEEASLADYSRELKGRNDIGLGASDVMGVNKFEGIVPMKEQTIGADVTRYKVLKPGAFAYNPMRLNIGSIARWHGDRDVLVSGDYVAFEAHPKTSDPRYIDHLRRSYRWKHYMEVAGSGSVRVRIYYKDLAKLKFSWPSKEEQSRIADVLDAADAEINTFERYRDLLKKQKRGLMQKLLTGQVRLCAED